MLPASLHTGASAAGGRCSVSRGGACGAGSPGNRCLWQTVGRMPVQCPGVIRTPRGRVHHSLTRLMEPTGSGPRPSDRARYGGSQGGARSIFRPSHRGAWWFDSIVPGLAPLRGAPWLADGLTRGPTTLSLGPRPSDRARYGGSQGGARSIFRRLRSLRSLRSYALESVTPSDSLLTVCSLRSQLLRKKLRPSPYGLGRSCFPRGTPLGFAS